MRIALITLGTRGDLQPFCALAEALADFGHDPLVVSNAHHAGFVERLGLRFQPIMDDTSAPDVPQAEWMETVRPALELGIARGILHADAVVSGPLVDDIASSLAELKRVPFILSGFAPYIRTPGIANPLIRQRPWPFEALNVATYRLADRMTWRPKAAGEAALRRRLGLPVQRRSRLWRSWASGGPYLGAWSPVLFPSPLGWGPRMDVTGAWRLSPGARARLTEATPSGLADWLAAGPAPIFLCVGAVPMLDPAQLVDWCARIAQSTGRRVLIGAGGSDLAAGEPAAGVRVERGVVDDDWLFPQCSLIVHHGGAATTDTALRAGRPALAIARLADGPFWGHRLQVLGVGDHIARAKLDEAGLTRVIERLLAPDIAARAAALGAAMHVENGAGRAAKAISTWAEQRV